MTTISAEQWEKGILLDIETLWQDCYQSVYHLVLHRVHEQQEVAEDLTSMTFLRAYEALLKKPFVAYKPYAGFLWLRRIASNLVIDYYRNAGTRLSSLIEDWRTIDRLDDSNFEEQVETRVVVGQVLALLPVGQQVLLYQCAEGMTYTEIGAMQGGICRQYVAKQMNIARQSLQQAAQCVI